MAAIPVTTYSAAKVHELVRQQFKNSSTPDDESNSDSSFLATSPATEKDIHNYNGKLMNSIWGMYNLYAAHAFQKNTEGPHEFAFALAFPQAKIFSLWESFRSRH